MRGMRGRSSWACPGSLRRKPRFFPFRTERDGVCFWNFWKSFSARPHSGLSEPRGRAVCGVQAAGSRATCGVLTRRVPRALLPGPVSDGEKSGSRSCPLAIWPPRCCSHHILFQKIPVPSEGGPVPASSPCRPHPSPQPPPVCARPGGLSCSVGAD